MPMPVSTSLNQTYQHFKTRVELEPKPKSFNGERLLLSAAYPHQDVYNSRFTSSLLSALRPGSKFSGFQRSGSSSYPVSIDLKCVDVGRSSFCGYLTINDLSVDFPSVTTFFDAEIIGTEYNFLTRKWGASADIDFQHWSRFPAFEKYKENFNKDGFEFNPLESDFIFMRWKEEFLVPYHKVKKIEGISFSGFYYICYQVSTGHINGFYYHPKAAEWFQEVNLQHHASNQFAEFEFR